MFGWLNILELNSILIVLWAINSIKVSFVMFVSLLCMYSRKLSGLVNCAQRSTRTRISMKQNGTQWGVLVALLRCVALGWISLFELSSFCCVVLCCVVLVVLCCIVLCWLCCAVLSCCVVLVVLCCVVLVVLCFVVFSCLVLCWLCCLGCAVLCCAVLCCAVLCCVVLSCCVVLCCVVGS